MILLFPNLETLRLALTSTIVSTDVTLTPAAVTFDHQGKIYLETTSSLSRTTIKNLDKIGVKGSKRHATEKPEEVTCWPQIIALTKESGTPNVSNQAPVLFELSEADDLPTLVGEMLRLGNDRQSFRWFAAPNEDDSRRVLLRVIGPPYYTLLRAIDQNTAGTKGTVRAYLERASRVWIELGYNHPFAGQIRVAEKQLLLLRSPRDWLYLDEMPFQDVYDIMQFKLPAAPVGWKESQSISKMSVPLRLTAGNAADVPELWVLRENAIEQLDTLVRESDERLTQRLKFAVADDAKGKRTVILRTIPSKLPPPSLTLENALGFKPFWKLPNLFIPTGRRLHPTLRRDAVRKLLADDADQVVWLYPGEGGVFTPESVKDGAFRSLEQWVDYVIEMERQPLAEWIEATRFEFDRFVFNDESGPKNKPDRGDKNKDGSGDANGPRSVAPVPKGPAKGKQAPPSKFSPANESPLTPPAAKEPSEWVKRRIELEEQFKSFEGALDSPERRALWPELAAANAGVGNAKIEAAICWLNAMWGAEQIPAEWHAAWLKSEIPSMGSGIKSEAFDKYLARPEPSQEEARATVASFLWLAAQKPIPAWLPPTLPAMQSYLERFESNLPVRAVWLTGLRLSQLSGADVLGLARIRDRLLQRLLKEGLTAERDLPLFLRVAGRQDSQRMRTVNEKALELHSAVRRWVEHYPVNLPYVDLFFAYALAKLGESSKARRLMEDARKVMEVPIPIEESRQSDWKDPKHFEAVVLAVTSNFLFKAFKFRIEQVLAGKRPSGRMSNELLAELEELGKKARSEGTNNPFQRAEYVIGRFREQSRIIEPHERVDPYATWTKIQDELKKELEDLESVREPVRLEDQIRKLLKSGVQGRNAKEVEFLVLHKTLPLAARVGESFTVELLQKVPAALLGGAAVGTPESNELPKKQGELLERALFMAGHFDRRDIIKKLVDEFSDLIHDKPEDIRFKLINTVAGQCLRSLKKLGMRDEIDRFLSKLRNEVLRGATTAELRKKYAAKPEMWSAVLQTLQSLASGWLTFGLNDQAIPRLNDARNDLLPPQTIKLDPKDYVPLARAYVTACGQFTSEDGLDRITEFFRKMDEKRISNNWTTNTCYSRFHLNIVEDVVQAIASDDFALGPTARRWLDDDEYLVRKRIHADMRREREKSGL